ncbi:CPBP family intramembrane metalloprotease [Rubrobacter marinus]|uniref:CPBP family intramembrane metalloprotease n=1 Tax=Rubrobacter marinus TaxID=2653852 RepID=A0A6G8PYI4_9ACTN|nr:CPBP family intramembrane glutamic endopeptidase [Rubrobacter marinus]QIN79207.1 CPBP family intramembrane metalloprotease [Rubrobacter marinus]
MIKAFVERHPLAVALLLAASSFGIAVLSVTASRRPVVSDVGDVAPEDLEPPTEGEQTLALFWSTENFFWFAVALLAVGLLAWAGWLREAGFGWPRRWRNARLLALPLLVGVLALSDGVRVPGVWIFLATLATVLVAVFGEEALFRGLMLRVLAPSGLLRAVVATSLLAGALTLGVSVLTGPWPEAVQATALATCGGFTYAALRWRTASLWPAVLAHALISLSVAISTPGATLYLIVLLLGTVGFVAYGLFLLRNPRAREDGGPPLRPPRGANGAGKRGGPPR